MTTTNHTHGPCPVCEGSVYGRSDKRFCTVKCKNQHHAVSRKMNRPMSVETNRRQGRNLVLLEGILGSKGSVLRIHQSELAKHGFCFETVTGVRVFTNKIVYQCYHFSYTIGVDGIVRIKRHDQVRCHLPGFYERWVLEYPETLIQENKRVALKTMQLKMRDS